MSRMYYYSRINRSSRKKKSGNLKFIVLGALLIISVYMLSADIEPQVQVVEQMINDQVEEIDKLETAE